MKEDLSYVNCLFQFIINYDKVKSNTLYNNFTKFIILLLSIITLFCFFIFIQIIWLSTWDSNLKLEETFIISQLYLPSSYFSHLFKSTSQLVPKSSLHTSTPYLPKRARTNFLFPYNIITSIFISISTTFSLTSHICINQFASTRT